MASSDTDLLLFLALIGLLTLAAWLTRTRRLVARRDRDRTSENHELS